MNGGALLFRDLAVMMTVVGVSVEIFSRFGWPKVLGFILAGVLMGANSWSGAWLVDETSVQSISQLGIFFLMVALGLDYAKHYTVENEDYYVPRTRKILVTTA